jgi:hypothetical protein
VMPMNACTSVLTHKSHLKSTSYKNCNEDSSSR